MTRWYRPVETQHHSAWQAWLGPFSRALTGHLFAEFGGLPSPLGDVIELNPLKA